MKFRAVLMGVEGLERPQQTFGSSLREMRGWAKATLARWPEGTVEIRESVETVRERLTAGDFPAPEAKE